jgi:hypothetical protein
MAGLCCTLRGVHEVLKTMTPKTDFSERVCVNLASFVFKRVARDLRHAETIEVDDWPKVTRFFANVKLTVKVVAHTAHSPMLKEYLSRVNGALPELTSNVDNNEDLQVELALALRSLVQIGEILGEVDFSYMSEHSRIGEIIAILKKAGPPTCIELLTSHSIE